MRGHRLCPALGEGAPALLSQFGLADIMLDDADAEGTICHSGHPAGRRRCHLEAKPGVVPGEAEGCWESEHAERYRTECVEFKIPRSELHSSG
jgi:hypothetical protein